MKIPFWEKSYQDDTVSTFGITPNPTIEEFRHLFHETWKVLDIGCGDGKNSLHFARLGYSSVDAFDLSENAIRKLNRLAEKQRLRVNAWVQDLRQFTFIKPYDLIISFGTLHFVEKAEWKRLLTEAKKHTNKGGIHIIQLFTNVVPPSPDIEPFAVGLADDKEIESVYQDWHILQLKSYTFQDEHPGVPVHFHSSNKIVVQNR